MLGTRPAPASRRINHHIIQFVHMSRTYIPKNSLRDHKPLNHTVHETQGIRRKRLLIAAIGIVVGPLLLIGGLMGLWFLVALAVVGIFKVLPLIKA